MANELSTIGIRLKYAVETTAGTKPTTFATEIPDIISIGEIALTPDKLEVTNLVDTVKRYIDGVQDAGDSVDIGANFVKGTGRFATVWQALKTASDTAEASGKATWFEISVPSFGAFYFSGTPSDLPFVGAEVNNVFQGNVSITLNGVSGWTLEE